MSGHSKWSTIKRKKEAKDIQKGKVFTKLAHLITIATIEGGGLTDPATNIRLRLAIEKAKEANMPKDNIERAIEKGSGEGALDLKEVYYEGFAPGAVALIIHATTDNSNRTIAEIRSLLERMGGKLGSSGSVSYLFQKCARITFLKSENDMDAILVFADSLNAYDVIEEGEEVVVYFPFDQIGKVAAHIGNLKKEVSAEVDFRPTTVVTIEDKQKAQKILTLIESLEALDDVQKVYANFDIPEEFLSL